MVEEEGKKRGKRGRRRESEMERGEACLKEIVSVGVREGDKPLLMMEKKFFYVVRGRERERM